MTDQHLTPPGNHGDAWHDVGRCGYCDARRSRAADAYFGEHPEQFPELIVATGPEPTVADLLGEPAFTRGFRLHPRNGPALDGAAFPSGRVVVLDDPEFGLATAAASVEDLLRGGYDGARIEWAEAPGTLVEP